MVYIANYMTRNGHIFSEICCEFHQFSQPDVEFSIPVQYDALWVRAKVANLYQFYPPAVMGWRYELLNIPFLAVVLDKPGNFFSLHPFVCIENDLRAGLEFHPTTSPEDCLTIANAFWQALVAHPGLTSFVDVVSADRYDGYNLAMILYAFKAGYWNNTFHLENA